MKSYFLWMSKGSDFLKWNLLLVKCYEEFLNEHKGFRILYKFDNKAVSGFERIDSNFERSSTVDEVLSNNTACYRETIHERKSQSMQQILLLS